MRLIFNWLQALFKRVLIKVKEILQYSEEVIRMSHNNDKICPICKFFGRIAWGEYKNTFYMGKHDQSLHLCYGHSVDLFKIGQKNFMVKYDRAFRDFDLIRRDSFDAQKLTFGAGFR